MLVSLSTKYLPHQVFDLLLPEQLHEYYTHDDIRYDVFVNFVYMLRAICRSDPSADGFAPLVDRQMGRSILTSNGVKMLLTHLPIALNGLSAGGSDSSAEHCSVILL